MHTVRESIRWSDIRLEKEKVNPLSEYIYSFIMIFIGSLGTVLLAVSCFDFEIEMMQIIIMTLVASVVPYVFWKNQKKIIKISLFLLLCVVIAIFSKQIIMSSFHSINRIIETINVPYDLNISLLNMPQMGIWYDRMDLFVSLGILVITMVVGYTVLVRHSLMIAMLIPVSVTLFCFSFDIIPSLAALVLSVVYFMMILSLSGKPQITVNSGIPVIIANIFFVIFVIVSMAFPQKNYQRNMHVEAMREWVQSTFSLNVYHDAFNIGEADTANGGICGGRLGTVGNIKYANKVMLTIDTGAYGKNQYYRSFYGAYYSDNRWGELPREVQVKYEVLFDRLKRMDIDSNVQTTNLLHLLSDDSNRQLQNNLNHDEFKFEDDVKLQGFSVLDRIGENSYWYLPYANTVKSPAKSSGDGYPLYNKTRTYAGNYYSVNKIDYAAVKNLVDTYKGSNAEMKTYVEWETEYRKYVHDVYTIMPESNLDVIRTIAQSHSVKTEAERQKYIEYVTKYLADNYKYTLSPGVVPEGKDFAEYFLNESKSGYCTYFATAATLMFRAVGIPARYVEGYAITDSQITTGIKSEENLYNYADETTSDEVYDKYTVDVCDNNAHAWVEIYEDGYGWIPIEATPGVYSPNPVAERKDENQNDTANSVPEQDTSTTIPSASNTAKSDSSGNSLGQDISKNRILLVVAVMMVVVAGIIVVLCISYQKSKHKLLMMFTAKSVTDTDAQILHVFGYIEKLCVFLNVSKPDYMDYEEYAKYLNDRSEYFAECDINAIIGVVLKVRFGNHVASKEEAQFVTEEAAKLRNSIYGGLGRFSRIRFRYFSRL